MVGIGRPEVAQRRIDLLNWGVGYLKVRRDFLSRRSGA